MTSSLPQFRTGLRIAAWLWLACAFAAAVLTALDPYEHGIWLVAYLALVGFLAQALLSRGQDQLTQNPERFAIAEAALWNLGVIAVPTGVLVDVRLLIAAGSVALIAALVLFWLSVRPSTAAGPEATAATRRAYLFLLVFMLVSVLIGLVLSADTPWTG